MRDRIFSSVLLPAPLRPMTPMTSPCPMSNDTSRKAQKLFCSVSPDPRIRLDLATAYTGSFRRGHVAPARLVLFGRHQIIAARLRLQCSGRDPQICSKCRVLEVIPACGATNFVGAPPAVFPTSMRLLAHLSSFMIP